MRGGVVQEQELRDLAGALRTALPDVVADDAARDGVARSLDAALALPDGQAERPLVDVLTSREDTREWVARQIGDADVVRLVTGLPGAPTAKLGLYFVCPNGDYDRYLESVSDDAGVCPYDGSRLVRSDD
jgi:hypothetical protein